jgi:hypothetical protein
LIAADVLRPKQSKCKEEVKERYGQWVAWASLPTAFMSTSVKIKFGLLPILPNGQIITDIELSQVIHCGFHRFTLQTFA